MIERMVEPDAAVAVVTAGGGSVLLMRRAERRGDPWSGHWALPGGGREPGDPDLLHTALRELQEECGIRLRPEDAAGSLPPMQAGRGDAHVLLVAPFVFRAECELAAVPDQREAVEARWVPLSLLRDPRRHCLRPVPGMPEDMFFPAIELGEMPLWGFTYRLIAEWLGPPPDPAAGFDAAAALLQLVLEHARLCRDWTDCTATVRGCIPVDAVRGYLAGPGGALARSVNLVMIRPDSIRVVGLAREEYFIRAVHEGRDA